MKYEDITTAMADSGRYPDPIDTPACARCLHVLKIGTLDGKGWTCKAFPDGILSLIVTGKARHDEHLPYDNGYLYECEPEKFDNGMWSWSWTGTPIHQE